MTTSLTNHLNNALRYAVTRWVVAPTALSVFFQTANGSSPLNLPKQVYKMLRQKPEYEIFTRCWAQSGSGGDGAGEPETTDYSQLTRVVRLDTWEYRDSLARSRTWFTDVPLPAYAVPGREQVWVLLGQSGLPPEHDEEKRRALYRAGRRANFIISNGAEHTEGIRQRFGLSPQQARDKIVEIPLDSARLDNWAQTVLERFLPKELNDGTGRIARQRQRKARWKVVRARVWGMLRRAGLFRNENFKKLAQYKNKYIGKRCFLVGNGPSLSVDDLNLIKDEYSFGCNKIFEIFPQVDWRPSFYAFLDDVFIEDIIENRESLNCPKFLYFDAKKQLDARNQTLEDTIWVDHFQQEVYTVSPSPMAWSASSNATVMTFMIELAIYMGFSEIYLIGVDCTNAVVSSDGGPTHFVSGYHKEGSQDIAMRRRAQHRVAGKTMSAKELGDYYTNQAFVAYDKLKTYAEKRGVHIYNATRGGLLEKYERRNLDDLFA